MSSEPQQRLAETLPSSIESGDVKAREVDLIIEAALEQLVEQGPLEDPQMLRDLIPQMDSEVRSFALFELIKMDMAMGAEQGPVRRIERYIVALPDLLSVDNIPMDLLLEELQLRREQGEDPKRDEYARRFPHIDAVLDAMFGQLSSATEVSAATVKMGAPPEQTIGSQLDDFVLLQKLGQGAFAHVYLARQLSMRRLVALKVSRGRGDEPQALAQFDHPNIVRVYDQRAVTEEGLHLLYMQFLPGGTLADVVRAVQASSGERRGSLLLETVNGNLLRAAQVRPDRSLVRDWVPDIGWPAVVAWIGVQLARGLDHAHERGVLHRDVKPANVLMTSEGIPKLADFNVSQAGAAGRAGASACFGGSIGYMAPEHLRAISPKIMDDPEQVRESADLYSLAILLWELWQGHRPFDSRGTSTSWSETVAEQLAARERTLIEPQRIGTASERVLEKVLRKALTHAADERLGSGAEMAGRLRLALHPDAADLFDPDERSIRARLSRCSPWLVAAAAILLPNIAAGVFNYLYNHLETDLTSEMRAGLDRIAVWVNLIAFPLGGLVMIWYTRGWARAVRMAKEGLPVASEDLGSTVDVGLRAAWIGGAFWMIAGIVYPLVLWSMYADFTSLQAAHFFMSLLICGGVAMIYPFFACALVVTLAYYPRLVSNTMHDSEFDVRSEQMVRRSEVFLLIAAIIPLLGAALMISSESSSRAFMLSAIGAGIVGLLASFYAYRIISRRWALMGQVLSPGTSVIPGENDS